MSGRLPATVIALALGATTLATTGLVTGIPTVARAAETPIPSVTPVPTTADSVPFGSTDADVAKLAAFGYVQEEQTRHARHHDMRRPADQPLPE